MKTFPSELRRGADTVVTLDSSRLLLAFSEPQVLEEVTQQLRTLGLDLEPQREEEGLSAEAINHTDRRFWVRAPGGGAVDPESRELIAETFGGRLDWIGPVYRLPGVPGRLGLHCPLPNSLIVKVSRTDGARLREIAGRYSIREDTAAEAFGDAGNTDGYRRYLLSNSQELDAYRLRTLLREQAPDDVAEALFENMPLVSPFTRQVDDPLFAQQWNLNRIQAPAGWDLSLGEPGIIICIFDTGCDLSHPDLARMMSGLSIETTGNGETRPLPGFAAGHGTMCAGVAAATANNQKGLAGVAGRCRILPVAFNNFTEWEFLVGLNYASRNGARVVSMSFIVYSWDPATVIYAITLAHSRNVIMCASSGNGNIDNIGLPGNDDRVITCGASTRTLPEDRVVVLRPDGSVAWGSNFGRALSVVAPGLDVPTTVVHGTGTAGGAFGADYTPGFWGTSASAPHVAGLAALILSVRPDLKSERVRRVIESTADKIGTARFDPRPNGSWNQFVGYGRINVLNAMREATTLRLAESVPIEAIHQRRLEVALRAHEREVTRIDKGGDDSAAKQVHETWIRLGRDPAILRLIHDIVRDPNLAAELRRDHGPILRERGIGLPEGTVVHVIDSPSRYPSAPTQTALRFEFTVAGIRCTAEWDPELGFSGETLSAHRSTKDPESKAAYIGTEKQPHPNPYAKAAHIGPSSVPEEQCQDPPAKAAYVGAEQQPQEYPYANAAYIGRAGYPRLASWKERLTGADRDTNRRWQVAGTDLGIPYLLENGSIGYLFGDTFNTQWPEGPPLPNDWRSPVMLRSNVHPSAPSGIVFDSAAKVFDDGRAPEILDHNAHDWPGGCWPNHEITCIPNDGISFPETGRQVISFQSINRWAPAPWRSRYATLAYSDNGNDFIRVPNLAWWNTESNDDPYQMWTMQRDGDWVYVFSVRSGRQLGPMMLQRVRWQEMFFPSLYQGWGWNGSDWGWGRPCSPILCGVFGEPSVRKLADGTWAMCYLNAEKGNERIVSRTASGPDRLWSDEKLQVSSFQEPNLYGGFIHPWSKSGNNNLHILVSKWTRDPSNPQVTTAYHVSQYVGTL